MSSKGYGSEEDEDEVGDREREKATRDLNNLNNLTTGQSSDNPNKQDIPDNPISSTGHKLTRKNENENENNDEDDEIPLSISLSQMSQTLRPLSQVLSEETENLIKAAGIQLRKVCQGY